MNKCSKISGKVLVVQLGREETQLVLVGSGKEILYGTTVTTPVGAVEDGVIRNSEAIQRLLKDTLRENPELKKTRQTVFCLSTSQVIAETVTTPDLPVAKLDKLIQANADMYFPVDVKDYQLVWQSIGPKASENGLKELMVQLWAVPNSMLSPYYSVANRCGLSVVAIDFCGHAIASAVGASFAKPAKGGKKKAKLDLNMEISLGKKKKELPAPVVEEEAEPVSNPDTDVHLLVDKDLLGMTCVQNGQVVFQRFIRCGGDPTYQLGELAMMLEYFKAMDIGRGSQLHGIYFGELAGNVQLAEDLADLLAMPLVRMDVPYSLHWVACIGAAHTDLDFGVPSLNKPGKAKKELQSNLWQYMLILLGGLMLISSFFYLMNARLNWAEELARTQAEILSLQMESQKYNGFADNYDNYISEYNKYSQDWDNIYASLQTYNDNLVLVMEELEQILPEKAAVADMQIGATGLNVTFSCENKEEAAYLIMALRDMQYADLLAVSSLTGGGAGPASSYGSGNSGEKAPVEGDSAMDSATRYRLAASLERDMDPYMVGYELGLGKGKPELLDTLADVYGIDPDSSYTSIESAPATFQQRTDAFYTMCTTNPIAMQAAEEMLREDYMNGGSMAEYLMSGINADVLTHRSPEDLEEDVDDMMYCIFYNEDGYTIEEIFPNVEALLASNAQAESWYLYYLEGEVSGSRSLPYLNVNKMAEDLADGKFDSGNSTMDEALMGLLSSETLAILEEQNQEPTEPGDSTEPGATEDPGATTQPTESLPTLPTDPNDPFATDAPTELPTLPGIGGVETVDTTPTEPSAPTEPSTPADPTETPDPSETTPPTDPDALLERMEQVMESYLSTGETGLNPIEELMVQQALQKYMPDYVGMSVEEILDEQLTLYFTYGESDFPQFDDAIDDYLTEHPEKEADLEQKYQKEVTIEQALQEFLSKGDTRFEEKEIRNYLKNGDSGNTEYNTALDAFVAAGGVDAELKALLKQHKEDPNLVKNSTLKQMLENFEAGTGSTVMNAQLKVCQEALDKEPENTDPTDPSDKPSDPTDPSSKPTDPTKPAEPDSAIKSSLKEYLASGIAATDGEKIKLYLLKGETGDPDADKELNAFVSGGGVYSELKTLLAAYLKDTNSITNSVHELMLDNYATYVTTGTQTGCAAINGQLYKCHQQINQENAPKPTDVVVEVLKEYLDKGMPTRTQYDEYIEYFLMNGSAKDGYKGKELVDAIEKAVADGAVDGALKKLIELYSYNKNQIASDYIAIMFGNYYFGNEMGYKTTGSRALDDRIKALEKELLDDLVAEINKKNAEKTAGQPYVKPDTHIYFTVVLQYNDELRNAELERKGLNYEDKIPMIEEVGE